MIDFEGIIVQTDNKSNIVFSNNIFNTIRESDQSELLKVCTEVLETNLPQRFQLFLNDNFYVFMVVPLILSKEKPTGVALTGFPVSFRIFKNIVLDNISDIVFYISIQDNNFILKGANSVFFEFTGLKEADVIGKNIKDIMDNSHYEEFLTQYQIVSLEKKVIRWEIKTNTPGGEKYGDVILAPISDKHECHALIGIVHDVTLRKQAEIELAKNYSILNEIVESTADVIFIKDFNGHYILVNSAAARMVGRSSFDLIGKKDLEIFSEATASQFMTNDRLGLESGVMRFFEEEFDLHGKHYFFHSAKGPYRDEKGEIAGTIGISRDISEIKLAQKKLAQSFASLKATLDATADGILVLDKHKKITHYNQRFLSFWKISEELLVNNEYEQILQKVLDQLQNPKECLERLAKLEKYPDSESYDLLFFKDGRMLERYTIPQVLNGEVIGRVFSYRDLSQRDEARARIQNLQK